LRERAEELASTALATPNAVGFQAMEFKDRALPAQAHARRNLTSTSRLVCWLILALMAGNTDFWRNGPLAQTTHPRKQFLDSAPGGGGSLARFAPGQRPVIFPITQSR
jgi:hypothetical protein